MSKGENIKKTKDNKKIFVVITESTQLSVSQERVWREKSENEKSTRCLVLFHLSMSLQNDSLKTLV